jgi:hypothetical protein
MLMPVTCTTLGQLAEGQAEGVVNHELLRCLEDLDKGGDDGKVRKCVIQLEFTKEHNLVQITLKAQAKLPAIVSEKTAAKMTRQRGQARALFETANAENPDQPNLPLDPE